MDSKKLILVVDDSSMARKMLKMILSSKGYQTTLASDGVEALSSIEQELPALVLMDVNMQGMDGIETVRQLRAQTKTQKLPVLIMTTSVEASRVQPILEPGITELLVKPLQAPALLTKVSEVLGGPSA